MKRRILLLTAVLYIGGAHPVQASSDDVLDAPMASVPESDSAGHGDPDSKSVPIGSPPAQTKSADEETIYVVQGKPYLVAGSFEISPQVVQSVNDRFVSHSGLLLSGIYHLKENVAWEVSLGTFLAVDENGMRLGGRDTDLTTEIRQKEKLNPEHVQLYQFDWMVTSDLQWSPVYGKVSLQDILLGQFNMYLSVGAGALGLRLEEFDTANRFVELPKTFGVLPPLAPTATFGGGLRFYFANWIGARIEIRDYVTALAVYADKVRTFENTSTFDVTNTVLAQLGVSFIF